MEQIFKYLGPVFETVQERWHTKTGYLAACFIFSIFCFLKVNIEAVGIKEVIVLISGCVIIWMAWYMTMPKKISQNKLGIGLAIAHDNTVEAQTLLSDFKIALRGFLNSSKLSSDIEFLDIPQRIAKDINDTDKATYWAKKTNLTLIIYGNIRLRSYPEGTRYVLDWQGLVRHIKVNENIKAKFQQDFTFALPKRFLLSANEHLPKCELVASHLDIVTKYIAGITLGFSYNFAASEMLLKEAENKLSRLIDNLESTEHSIHLTLLGRVRDRLADLYLLWMNLETHAYIMTRSEEALEKSDYMAGKLLHYAPSNHEAILNKAIAAFVIQEDVEKSRELLENCENKKEAAFLYCVAFLEVYTGDLDRAYKAYMKAFRAPLSDITIPIQAEEFIQIILEKEPEKTWLYFALGLINHRAKKDYVAAKRDFSNFLESAGPGEFDKQTEIVNRWIENIEELEITS